MLAHAPSSPILTHSVTEAKSPGQEGFKRAFLLVSPMIAVYNNSMKKGLLFRCGSTTTQELILLRWLGCQRSIDTAKMLKDQCFRTFARKPQQHADPFAPADHQYAQFLGEDTAWLRELVARHSWPFRGNVPERSHLSSGWFDPVDKLCADIEHLAAPGRCLPLQIAEIKEKCDTLRLDVRAIVPGSAGWDLEARAQALDQNELRWRNTLCARCESHTIEATENV